MRRIERPTLVDLSRLVFGVEPGGVIEAVIDDGRFVYEIGEKPVSRVDHLFGRVTLDRAPLGEITMLVRRDDRLEDAPTSLTGLALTPVYLASLREAPRDSGKREVVAHHLGEIARQLSALNRALARQASAA